MSDYTDTLNRILARSLNTAVPIRTASSMSSDPTVTIGIATIKIVTEEQIQALAFGPLNATPTLILRVNPIGRDVADLAPFATFLDQVASRAIAAEGELRVWVPHAETIEALDILGHRYWRNQNAPTAIHRMGVICRNIAHLQDHAVTGLAPVEEGHLGAMLAWFDPAVRNPLVEARDRIRLPASGILVNTPDQPMDDRIDRLRKDLKSATGRRRTRLISEIEDILRRGILREWNLLVEARRAFLALGLSVTGLEQLASDSKDRMANALQNGHFPARRPDMLAQWLGEMETGVEKAEFAALEADPIVREEARRVGAAVQGVVTAVRQRRPRFKPCTIEVDSVQGTIRLRSDDKVRIAGSSVTGIVRAFQPLAGGGTRISVEIKDGVRQVGLLSVGARFDILKEPYGFVNYRAMKHVRERQPWAFFGAAAPALAPGPSRGVSAIRVAAGVRRP